MDVTLHLANNRLFGRYIYMALCITKSMVLSLIIFIPTLCAFAFAFHAFSFGKEIFKTSALAFFKTIIMLIGEFEFSSSFVVDGRVSAQVTA